LRPQPLNVTSSAAERIAIQPRGIHISFRPRIKSNKATLYQPLRSSRPRYNGTRPSPDPTPNLGSPQPSLSLSQRLKALSKEYGWTALAVYLGLSALDFPFCFLAVQILGPERVGRAEHAVVSGFWSVIAIPFPSLGNQEQTDASARESDIVALAENEEKSGSNGTASIWTQLALAYAVHKSLIFFRVPLTAAVLPKVVKTLRSWGYNVGKKPISKITTKSKPTTTS